VIGSLPSGRRRATRHLAGTAGMPNGQSWGRKRNATRPRPFPQATARRLVPGPRRTCRTPRRISQPVRVLLSPNRIRSVGSADSRRPGSTRANSPAARTTRIAARGAVSSPRRVIAIGGRGRQLKIATGGGGDLATFSWPANRCKCACNCAKASERQSNPAGGQSSETAGPDISRKSPSRTFEAVLEEGVDLLVRLLGRVVALAVGHADAVVEPEQLVNRNGVVERHPALGRVLRAAGDQERPRGHEGVQLVQVAALFDHLLVRP